MADTLREQVADSVKIQALKSQYEKALKDELLVFVDKLERLGEAFIDKGLNEPEYLVRTANEFVQILAQSSEESL